MVAVGVGDVDGHQVQGQVHEISLTPSLAGGVASARLQLTDGRTRRLPPPQNIEDA